ncbi:MAG: Na/Pi symporter [Chryseolinea sp.]
METPASPIEPARKNWSNFRIVMYVLGAFFLFLFALELLTSSLQHMTKNAADTILTATSNPFTGLFIGLVITAMLQSSSTTTALVVAMVASGALTFEGAIPIIMGANIGTTITSIIVSLSFINKRKEFRRAVAAGTYHHFFNVLTAVILFPLEYYYGFLSNLAVLITKTLFSSSSLPSVTTSPGGWTLTPLTGFFLQMIDNPFIIALFALLLLFGSIMIFRRLISVLLKARSPESFSRFFFKNQIKSFAWGLVTTAAIRSSTVTTSVVVPIVAKKITSLRQAAPFIMGANVGTTITAFIAAALYTSTLSSISIAIVHFLFNMLGVVLFFPIPVLRKLPIKMAEWMGELTLKYRLIGFVYILLAFFFLPFSLIYFNQGAIDAFTLTYERVDSVNTISHYRVETRMNRHTNIGSWTTYEGNDTDANEEPSLIFPVSLKNESLFIGRRIFQLSRPGLCWEGSDERGNMSSCLERILPSFRAAGRTFDSVFVYRVTYPSPRDTSIHRYYLSAPYKVILQHQITYPKASEMTEKLVRFDGL